MTSQQRVCVCFVWACVCMCKCDLLQSRWEGDLSSRITSFCQKAFILAPRVTLCYRQMCACTHQQCEECLCVSYCWRQCRHSWEGCVLCSQQQSWPFALDFLSSSVLKKGKKSEKETKTYLGDAPDFGFLGSRTPHLILPPLKPRNKTASDMHVGWSIFWSTNLHPLCPMIDWPQ